MLSSVLHTEKAIEVNASIMRAFVKMRQVLFSNQELEKKIAALEQKYDGQFEIVCEAIREMMTNHAIPQKRIIGLAPKD